MKQNETKPTVTFSEDTICKAKQSSASRFKRRRHTHHSRAHQIKIPEWRMVEILADQLTELYVKREMQENESKKLQHLLQVVKDKMIGSKHEAKVKQDNSKELTGFFVSDFSGSSSCIQQDEEPEDNGKNHQQGSSTQTQPTTRPN